MRKKKVWRYWCEYCGKGGCSAGHMKKHEKHCTMNPNRTCRMCKYNEDATFKPVSELKKLVNLEELYVEAWANGKLVYHNEEAEKQTIEKLRDATGNCPACMLAVFRQLNIVLNFKPFDYKKECDNLWRVVNDVAL